MSVCVIGAGIAGIVAVKSCLEENLNVSCFEKTSKIGGLWRSSDDNNKIFDDTITNTSKEMTAFSDYPMPENYPNYLHNRLYLNYLESYCSHFKLGDCIRFEHTVVDVRKAPTYSSTGQWTVSVKGPRNDEIIEIIFDYVIVCNGVLRVPNIIDIPGSENFSGKIKHVVHYGKRRDYEDQTVLVCGAGNSACDIAVDLSSTAKKVYLSTRSGLLLVSRLSNRGLPIDVVKIKRFTSQFIPSFIASQILKRLANSYVDAQLYGLDWAHGKSKRIVLNDFLASKVLSGSVILKGPIDHAVPQGVYIKGEQDMTEVDTIIMATGYRENAEFLESSIISDDEGMLKLYKNVFPYDMKHPTLAFSGYTRSIGPLSGLYELQTRWIAQVFKGNLTLPKNEAMRQECLSSFHSIKNSSNDYTLHKFDRLWFYYIHSIASEIGAVPNIHRLILTDPRLAFHCLFGPLSFFQYRLNGPHKWKGARRAILTIMDRVKGGFNTGAHYDAAQDKKNPFPVLKTFMAISLLCFVYVRYRNKLCLPW